MSRSSRSDARRMRSNANDDNTLTESDNTRTFDNTSADVDSSSTFLNSALSSTGTESFADSKVTKHEIERKQLLHDLELLRIELSQKNLINDNMKAEHLAKVDELEENLSDARHEKQMLQARLESQLKLQQEESKGRLERMRREVNTLMNRMQQLERYNAELQDRAGDIRRNLDDVELSEEKYIDLKSTDAEQLTLKEFVMIKVYEASHPFRIQCACLQQQLEVLTQQLHSSEEDAATYQKEAEEERLARREVEFRAQKFSLQVDNMREKLEQGDYKSSTYDQVKIERDSLERELLELKKDKTDLQTTLKSKSDELQEIHQEMLSTKQSLALLKQDKEYLNRQMQELGSRSRLAEQRLEETMKQLNEVKQAREELYEKYITVREQYKSEYEVKLKDELQQVSIRTGTELDKIRNDTKEMFERENRNLREAKETALEERERALSNEKDITSKHDKLLTEFRKLQVEADSKWSELQNQVKVKQLEFERLQMIHDETNKNLKHANLDNEKNQIKSELLNKEFYALRNSTDKRITELETRCKDQQEKLATYEKLEQELDDVIMQAAELDNEAEAERVMFAYGYGANVPSTAKRRMQQSVHLARRVLQLERANTSLRNEVERESTKKDQLAEELSNATSLLNEAQQPYSYLIESIRTRDSQIHSMKEQFSLMEDDIRKLKEERDELSRTKNHMSADLERLLNQREEMAVMKKVMLDLRSSGHQTSMTRKIARTSDKHRTTESSRKNGAATSTPAPTIFTKSEPPSWFEKLKQRNLAGKTRQ